ncbi:MAG: DUF934 domain-containing protein [Gammaproteobacteria bacterium]|nr:MAG: DUF934 domain-containing protein [Gammaproteobacteria bacterium]
MSTLIKDNKLTEDPFTRIGVDDAIPAQGAVLVPLATWQDHREKLLRRGEPVGVWLKSDEHPEIIAGDVNHLQLIALEFPTFRDGRGYSYARLVRERYGFEGELRAVGDVLLEQLHYMGRVGFNAFEVDSEDALAELEIAARDFSVWYQPSADGRASSAQLRTELKRHG